MSEIRLGYSGLTGTVYVGKMREDKKHNCLVATGNRTDVTKDFHYAVKQYLEVPDIVGKKKEKIFVNSGITYKVTVELLETK